MTVTSTASTPQTGRVADDPDPEVPARAQRRRYSAAYKQKILAEYEALDRAGKGALLRREGLYTSLISAWREQRDQGALKAPGRPACRVPELATASDQRFQAAASYSLIKPPRIGRRRILPPIGSRTGASGRGGRNFSDRCGRRPL